MITGRPSERNYGCRVSDDYFYRGLRIVVLENKSLRVSVLADKGTDIFELLYKPLDIDFMYRAPAGVRDPRLNLPSIANASGAYLDFWHGGWQEAFPTGGWPCQYRGASFGLHGEASLLAWNHQIVKDAEDRVSVHFWTRTMRSPFLIAKTLTLEGEKAVLRISERVTNEGRTPVEFMWGHHPVIGPPFLDENCTITAPAETVVVPDEANWPHGRLKQGRYRWPMVEDRNGRATDASAVLPFAAGVADGMYLTDLHQGWCAISSGRLGLGFGLSWSKEVFPWIWLWHVAGGETESPFFGRNYNLAMEPFTSYPNTFDAVREAGTQRSLAPGESLEATVSATIFRSEGSIESISPEGSVNFRRERMQMTTVDQDHMKQAAFPDFPREEYESRWARTRKILKAAGIDALLLSNQENLRYFAGFHEGAWCCKHFYFFMLLPADETIAPCLIFANLFQNLAKASWVKEAHYWPWPKAFYMSHETNAVPLIVEVLKEKGLFGATIGLEMGANMHHGLGAEHFDHLRQALSKARIMNATNAIWDVRALKSSAELERLRKASAISCKGVKAGFEALRPGVTEREIAGIMHEVMFGQGATETGLMCVYAGPRLMWADSTPSDYKIQTGDVIQFDGGCLYDGYWSDFKRMAAIGEPRPEQRRYFELAKEGLEAAISVMKAGVASGEVFRAAFEVNNRAGHADFSNWCLEHGLRAIGHSIGLNIHEHPGLSYENPRPLEEGMAFAVEPFITLNGQCPFHEAPEKYGLEDNLIVTKDGVEMMTKEEYVTHELWIA